MLLKTIAQATAVLALTATAANAGLRASQDGDRVNINCGSGGCFVFVKPVGSRIHIFNMTQTYFDNAWIRPRGDDHALSCSPEFYSSLQELPRRAFSFAQSEVNRIRFTGNGKNERFELYGLEHISVDADMKGGNDIVVIKRRIEALLGDGHDCAYVMGGGSVSGQGGDDTITVLEGSFDVDGGDGSDEIRAGRAEASFLKGGSGDDMFYGSPGDDVIYAQGGDDRVLGGDGNDYIDGGDGSDELDGEEGDDVIYGGRGNDDLYGGPGDDYLRGNRGNDDLIDLEGVNQLNGDADNDRIEVYNAGSNANGGGGSDLCIVRRQATHQHCEILP